MHTIIDGEGSCFRTICGVALVFTTILFAAHLPAQTTNTAAISGHVRDEKGLPLRATVTAVSGGAISRAFSLADGAFQLKQLAEGTYALCAQVLATEADPRQDPFLDTCLWRDPSQSPVVLKVGKDTSGVVFTVKRGRMLKIHVNDPAKMLPPQVGAGASPHLQIQISSGSLTAHRVPMTGHDATGRDFALAIPFGVQHSVAIASSGLRLTDDGDREYLAAAPLLVQGKAGDAPVTYVVNVKGVKP